MTETPDPLVPRDLDLRDFRWMKLDLIALFNSDFNATPDDTAWRAGVTLWGKAWHQVPSGSLPNDDGKLCNLAGLGRDLKTWRRVRDQALHGFIVCSDGRLYHDFLCRRAMEAAAERERYSKRRAADRERKAAGNSAGIPPENPEPPPEPPPENPEIPAEILPENLIEGEGEGDGEGDSSKGSAPNGAGAARAPPPPSDDPVKAIFDRGVAILGPKGRSLIGKARKDHDDLVVIAAISACEDEGPSDPAAFFVKALAARGKRANGGILPNEGVF